MVGSALNGWDDDVYMNTPDGELYVLWDFYFNTGEAKFRQDGNWAINWGGDAFPAGIAVPDGPNIPVSEGFYTVLFNVETGDYNFHIPSIGILGSALDGWDYDIDMQSEDGITYTLLDYYFKDGEVKFRQDDNWYMNWGGDTFPDGDAIRNGPNIAIPEGTYNVTFNKLSQQYSFVATTCPNPELICVEPIYVDAQEGLCGAYVDYPEIVPAPNCGGDGVMVKQTSGLPSGSLFPVGVTTNTFMIQNATGDMSKCHFDVVVTDTQAPVFESLKEDYDMIWPPNHKMVEVYLDYTVVDNCGAYVEIEISSNEPQNGLGDGDRYPDWEVIDEHRVLLRAERSGKGNGRDYYISINAYDDTMNRTEAEVVIHVPHDRKIKNPVSSTMLYPNATDSKIHFKGEVLTARTQYQIFNMFGVMEMDGVLTNSTIDVRGLLPGMYVVKLTTADGNIFKKFIKK